MVVVNAGNFEQDWSWLTAVNEGRIRIDLKNPAVKVPKTTLVNLRDQDGDSLIDLAFQGPLTVTMLMVLNARFPTYFLHTIVKYVGSPISPIQGTPFSLHLRNWPKMTTSARCSVLASLTISTTFM